MAKGERGYTPTADKAEVQEVARPRNDVADFFYSLRDLFGADSMLGKLLDAVADWFEQLDGDDPRLRDMQGMVKRYNLQAMPGDCLATFVQGVQGDAVLALQQLAAAALERTKDLLDCVMGGATEPTARRSSTLQFVQQAGGLTNLPIACLLGVAWSYWRNRNVEQAVAGVVQCFLSSGGGGGTGGGGTGGGGGLLGDLFSNARRC